MLNLLPLPALDGGQLFLLTIEAARRKPLGMKAHQTAALIGLALFLIVTAVATYSDVMKLVA